MCPQQDSHDPGRIYLDANATTKPFPEVIETVAHHLRFAYANPGSRHAEGRKARRVLEESREKIADLLGASPDEVAKRLSLVLGPVELPTVYRALVVDDDSFFRNVLGSTLRRGGYELLHAKDAIVHGKLRCIANL